MSAGQRDVTEVPCSRTGGSLRHTQDLTFAPGRPLRGRPVRSSQILGVSETTPCSRTWYLRDVTLSSRHITIKLFSVGCFHFYFFCFLFCFIFWFLFVVFSLQRHILDCFRFSLALLTLSIRFFSGIYTFLYGFG